MDSLESDHYCIKSYFNVSVYKPSTTYSAVGNIANHSAFIASLSNVSEFLSVVKANKICDLWHSILDKHALPSIWEVSNHNTSPLFESIRYELF